MTRCRYADYIVTTPLVILLLGLVAGADAATIANTVGADSQSLRGAWRLTDTLTVVWVLCSYMGAVSVVTTVKWFWFLVSLIGLAGVIVNLARSFKEASNQRGAEIAELYGKAAWLIILTWFCYPIVWLFSEGFASFSVSFEVKFLLTSLRSSLPLPSCPRLTILTGLRLLHHRRRIQGCGFLHDHERARHSW